MKFIVDTGPLVALLNRRDRHHGWAREQWARIEAPLFTCEPVIAEACFLVRAIDGGMAAVLDLVHRGVLELPLRVADEADAISRLMRKYCDVPMSLADGCLVRMAERHQDVVVMTLDSDFRVYRKNGRQFIPILMPVS